MENEKRGSVENWASDDGFHGGMLKYKINILNPA